MKTFYVKVTQQYSTTVAVEANDFYEAQAIAREALENGEFEVDTYNADFCATEDVTNKVSDVQRKLSTKIKKEDN